MTYLISNKFQLDGIISYFCQENLKVLAITDLINRYDEIIKKNHLSPTAVGDAGLCYGTMFKG